MCLEIFENHAQLNTNVILMQALTWIQSYDHMVVKDFTVSHGKVIIEAMKHVKSYQSHEFTKQEGLANIHKMHMV